MTINLLISINLLSAILLIKFVRDYLFNRLQVQYTSSNLLNRK